MARVVDASVLVKMLCEEPGSAAARALFIAESALIAPDLALAEVHAALWRRMRRGLYDQSQLELVPSFLDDILAWTAPTAELVARAAALSVVHGHPVYDCLYVALAAREDEPLVTADERLVEVGRQAGILVEALGGLSA